MPLMDIKQKGIAAGSMRKSPGKGPERLLWGSIIICLHCYPLPWMFAVAACDKENTGPDGPSVWLCIVIVMFLTSLYISPWRWQKGHTFCPVESSLKQVKGKQKNAHGNPNRKHSTNTEAQVGACRATSLHAPWDLKGTSATCSQSTDADRQWNDLILFFFSPWENGQSDAYLLKARTHLGSSNTAMSQKRDGQ